MSRTFRRKNFEKVHQSRKGYYHGSKAGGFYTTYNVMHTDSPHNGGYCQFYRPMIEEEKLEWYWNIHGESKHNNAWGPNWYYRNMAEKQLRQRNKLEMVKAMADLEYEGFFYTRYAYEWDLSYW